MTTRKGKTCKKMGIADQNDKCLGKKKNSGKPKGFNEVAARALDLLSGKKPSKKPKESKGAVKREAIKRLAIKTNMTYQEAKEYFEFCAERAVTA